MTRLSLKVVYLWRHVSSTAPPIILWWWNLEILFAPLNRSSPFIGELRCQAVQMEHALILYSREDPKGSLYCEMSVVKFYLELSRDSTGWMEPLWFWTNRGNFGFSIHKHLNYIQQCCGSGSIIGSGRIGISTFGTGSGSDAAKKDIFNRF
jgi:hypothetical protein